MFKTYRIKKLKERIAGLTAEDAYYEALFGGVTKMDAYFIDKIAAVKRELGVLGAKLRDLEACYEN